MNSLQQMVQLFADPVWLGVVLRGQPSREPSRSAGTTGVSGEFWTACEGTGMAPGVRASVQEAEGPVMATASWQEGDDAVHSLGFLATTGPTLPFWRNVPEQAFRRYAIESVSQPTGDHFSVEFSRTVIHSTCVGATVPNDICATNTD